MYTYTGWLSSLLSQFLTSSMPCGKEYKALRKSPKSCFQTSSLGVHCLETENRDGDWEVTWFFPTWIKTKSSDNEENPS